MQDIGDQIVNGRIREARYNKRYKDIAVEGLPAYLREGNKNIEVFARIRCGNIEGCNKYWLKDKDKICKFCGLGTEDLRHLVEECENTKKWFERFEGNTEQKIKLITNEVGDREIGKIFGVIERKKKNKLAQEGSQLE